MAHVGASTAQAGPRTPAPAPAPPPPASMQQPPAQQQQAPQSERSEQKRHLANWWNNFKRSDKKPQEQQQQQQQIQVPPSQGIFGVPLQDSIRYANVAISLFYESGEPYIYGYVPIVVAKCGVYLKEKATDVEGIFRLAGSEKRIKELKIQFDSPDRYGKGLDWTGYTVHDAANILRRYFNQLPEPIIPLSFYDKFRDPLRDHQAQAVGEIEAQSPSVGNFDHNAAIRRYQNLIVELPPLNRQLLLYILDLLAVFASKSDMNKMTTGNLSAIFQPGILSHPQHDMAPQEYRLSQDVLIFLIENQDSFLIGMQGTAADQETVRDVQRGSPSNQPPGTPTTPGRSKTILGRSSSNASAGAESVGKFGSIRRNVSLSSSKRSKRSEPGPTVVVGGEPTTPTSGVHRSNTVPSRRGGSAAASPRFTREKGSDQSTPSPANSSNVAVNKTRQESLQSTPVTATAPLLFPNPPEVTSASSSEATTPLARVGSETSAAPDYQTPKKDTIPLLAPGGSGDRKTERSPSGTPSTSGRALLDIFKQSPGSDDGRPRNKLKKRIPGSALSSAQSSNQSLPNDGYHDAQQRSPVASNFASAAAALAMGERRSGEHSEYTSAQATPTGIGTTSLQAPAETSQRRISGDNTLRPTISPSQSFNSTTESDADLVGDDLPKEQVTQPEKEKKSRRHRSWFSRGTNKLESQPGQQQQGSASGANPLGTMSPPNQTASRSTIGSGGAMPRRSFQQDMPAPPPSGPLASSATTDGNIAAPSSHPAATNYAGPASPPLGPQPSSTDPVVFSDSEREKKGPMSWLRGKLKDRDAEKERERRARTPERGRGSRGDLSVGTAVETPAGKEGVSSPHAVTAALVAVGGSPTGQLGSGAVAGGMQQQQQQQQQQPQPQTAVQAPPPPAPVPGTTAIMGTEAPSSTMAAAPPASNPAPAAPSAQATVAQQQEGVEAASASSAINTTTANGVAEGTDNVSEAVKRDG